MSKRRVQRVLTVPPKNLCDHGDDGEHHANQTVLEDACPNNVKPSETRPGLPEWPLVLAASTLLHEEHAPEPVDGRQRAEEFLLLVQAGRHVLAHECEETRDRKCFIAVSQHLEVDCVLVIQDAQEGDRRVNWNH